MGHNGTKKDGELKRKEVLNESACLVISRDNRSSE